MERIRIADCKINKRNQEGGNQHGKTNNKAGGTGDLVETRGSAENNVSPSAQI